MLPLYPILSISHNNKAAPAAIKAPATFSTPPAIPPASLTNAGGEVVGLGPVRPVSEGNSTVQTPLQLEGPAVEVQVVVCPVHVTFAGQVGRTGGAVGRTHVHVMLAEQGTGPAVPVQVTV